MSIEEIKKSVDEKTYLGDIEKQELLEKLKKIKSKKWQIAKNILSFILDKRADIAIMFIPQILKCIQ